MQRTCASPAHPAPAAVSLLWPLPYCCTRSVIHRRYSALISSSALMALLALRFPLVVCHLPCPCPCRSLPLPLPQLAPAPAPLGCGLPVHHAGPAEARPAAPQGCQGGQAACVRWEGERLTCEDVFLQVECGQQAWCNGGCAGAGRRQMRWCRAAANALVHDTFVSTPRTRS